MKNSKLLKVSKIALIILLIIAFSIGIVACGGTENISGSSSGSYTESPGGTETGGGEENGDGSETGGNTGETGGNTGGGTTTKPTFPANSYHTIYAPFVNWEDRRKGKNSPSVF